MKYFSKTNICFEDNKQEDKLIYVMLPDPKRENEVPMLTKEILFDIGCISTSQENAKAELIDWVCSTDTDAKRACEIMIENEAILFSEPRKKR